MLNHLVDEQVGAVRWRGGVVKDVLKEGAMGPNAEWSLDFDEDVCTGVDLEGGGLTALTKVVVRAIAGGEEGEGERGREGGRGDEREMKE